MKGLLVTYVLTYGGALASFVNPFYGLAVYIIFALIRPESLWFWSVTPGNYSRIVAMALLAGWTIHGLGNWNFGKAKLLTFCLLGFWLWAILSAAQAPRGDYAWAFIETKSKIFLPFLVGMTLVDSLAKIRVLAWCMIVAQGYVAFDLNLSYLQGFNRFHEIGFGGMDNNSAAIGMVSGAFLAFFVGVAERRLPVKLLAFFCAALMAHCCLIAFSRGAMLALLIAAMLVPFFMIRRRQDWWAIALGGVALVGMAGNGVLARFSTTFADAEERDGSAQSRLDLWADCMDAMLRHPVFGLGPDHWPLAAASYGWSSHKEAHSLWMQTGAELGVPGLTLLLGFYVVSMLMQWRAWATRAYEDEWAMFIPPMIITSILGFCISAQFVSLEGLEFPYYINLLSGASLKLAFSGEVRNQV